MKRIRRIVGLLALLSGMVALLEFRNRAWALLFWPAKLVAGGFSAVSTVTGGLAALAGLLRRDPLAALAGLAGSGLSLRYISQVIRPHDGFEQAFGPDWQARLPAEQRRRFLARRWQGLMLAPPAYQQRDLVFAVSVKTGQDLRADLWEPPAGVLRSGLGVIYIHGGAWRLGEKDMGTRPLFRRLANQGHVIMDINYTLAPAGEIPDMVAEIKQAIRWLKANATRYGVRPDRIALMGASAGAHLALLTAYAAHDPAFQAAGDEQDGAVRGVVAFYPPVDFCSLFYDGERSRANLMGKGQAGWPLKQMAEKMLQRIDFLPAHTPVEEADNFVVRLLGVMPHEDPELYRRLSPISYASAACPPTLLLQGSNDIFGLAPDVARLHRLLRQAGAQSILVEFPHTEHAFDLVFPAISPVAQAAIYDVERFLALLL